MQKDYNLEEPFLPAQQSQIVLKRIKLDVVYFKEQIDPEFKQKPIPDNVRRWRNTLIILIMFQIACCVAGLALYFKRRNRLILAAVVGALVISLAGFYGTIRVKIWWMFFHSFVSIGFLPSRCVVPSSEPSISTFYWTPS